MPPVVRHGAALSRPLICYFGLTECFLYYFFRENFSIQDSSEILRMAWRAIILLADSERMGYSFQIFMIWRIRFDTIMQDMGMDRRCEPERFIDVHHYGVNSHFACIGPCSPMPTYRPGAWGQGDT